ncbi:katanin p60 ATPase-containing subunit A-like 2 isoform X2 [Hydractinia symbiolongicarpus]|uniref:katanin p60 ATPase-containing subunit A-like 2 isoform X2 n=1 Tax=Hydractinia symbiolongicarpus TaxID=13093 RepID=UPI0025517C56|nr:katanin p60 ATPase-containing subunit A-like 2 isoform X2 [Hydractinia symbiolongicarpus]
MSHELSYQQLKNANEARISEEQRSEQRKRNILLLILHYMQEEGYLDSLNCLEHEAGVSLKKFEVCDNVDLQTVLQEYESYYYVKFNKWPKISKRSKDQHNEKRISSSKKSLSNKERLSVKTKSNSFSLPNITHSHSDSESINQVRRPKSDTRRIKNQEQSNEVLSPASSQLDISGVSGTSITTQKNKAEQSHGKKTIVDYKAILSNTLKTEYMSNIDTSERMLKPLAGYTGLSGEFRDLAAVVTRDIYLENPNVYWDDIIGLDEAKRLVKEAVVYPIRYPQLFTGILSPWKGLLLYGPPGTGKTLLAKAVATECNTTFFNISASTIVSKWRGDSEKLVRVLFELARFHAPSTIFLDELDSLMSQRGASSGGSGEHEGSRRMKTELLVQMDGLSKSEDLVFLLAASNLPWELDHAMLRRLEKRILVDLPTKEARQRMIEHHLPRQITTNKNGLEIRTEIAYEDLAEKTEGYSGSDIRLLCKEAAMRPVRKIFDVLEKHYKDFAYFQRKPRKRIHALNRKHVFKRFGIA